MQILRARTYVFIKYVYLFPKKMSKTIISRILIFFDIKWHSYCAPISMKNISINILKPETKVVVFDLDGTLYCKKGMITRMMAGAVLEWKMMLLERKTRKKLKGSWMGDKESFYRVYFQQMAKGRLFSVEYAQWWYNTRYMPMMVKVIKRYYQPSPWVIPFIQQCKSLGIRLVVLSDYTHTKEKIQALGLDDSLFDWIISAPELGGLKPAPELMRHVAAQMGVLPNQCLIIGDREDTDGELAKLVNAPFYLVK
jgi:HAD superfamily hydrolase (TIGR01549 family)